MTQYTVSRFKSIKIWWWYDEVLISAAVSLRYIKEKKDTFLNLLQAVDESVNLCVYKWCHGGSVCLLLSINHSLCFWLFSLPLVQPHWEFLQGFFAHTRDGGCWWQPAGECQVFTLQVRTEAYMDAKHRMDIFVPFSVCVCECFLNKTSTDWGVVGYGGRNKNWPCQTLPSV